MKMRLMLIVVFVCSLVISVKTAISAEYIWTDEPEYLKGDTAHIFGTGFAPYVPILIKVTRPDLSVVTGDGSETPGSDTVITNVDGNFAYSYIIDGIQAEGTYAVEAIDTAPEPDQVLATTSFLDTVQFLLQGCSWHKGDCTQEALPAWANGATPMDGWTSGVVKLWSELQYVPYRLRINLPKPGDAGTYYVTTEHDNLRSGVPGVDDATEFYVGKLSDGTLTKSCTFQATRAVGDNPTSGNPCIVTGETYTGVNDDPGNDGNIDEDSTNGINNDPGSDNLVDEDPAGSYTPARKIQDTWAVLFGSSEAGSSSSKWALYWKAHLAFGSSGFPGASLHADTTATGNQDVPIKNVQPPPTICGNGFLEGGEQCDDGNATSGDGCSAACIIEYCGDGILHPLIGETCDDGNNLSGDGCSATCQVEPPPPAADLFINKAYTGSPNPGKVLSFTVQYGNTGGNNAANVVVTDDYDQTYIITSNICCGGIDDGNKITWNIGAVPAWSGPFTLTYDGKIHDGTIDTNAHMPIGDTHVVNVATIITTSMDSDPSDNISTVDILVHAEPNLFVTKSVNSVSHIQVKPGDTVTIALTYGNSDNNDAPNVTLCDDYNQAYLLPTTISDGGVDNGDKICWGLNPDPLPGFLPGVIPGTRTLPGVDPVVNYQALVIDNPVNWEDPATITTTDPEPPIKLANNIAKVLFTIEQPTAVRLSSFNAINTAGQVIISWRTGSEVNSEGFHIWRSTDINGPYLRITPALIVSQGSVFRGENYSFVDTQINEPCLQKCYYRLEELDSRGNSTNYGPVVAVAKESGGEQMAGERSGYTLVTNSDGTARFLSGETADREMIQQVVKIDQLEKKRPDIEERSQQPKNEISQPYQESRNRDTSSHESIRFKIIDIDGNEVAIASLNEDRGDFAYQNLDGKDQETLHPRWEGDSIIITWYANEPVKGFHLLRSTKKDGPYQKITKTLIPYLDMASEKPLFHYTYTDTNVKSDKRYYYKLEPIYKDDNKSAYNNILHPLP